uniref:Uncharacterized protein n=1 Tax=virus sp. ct1Uu26 TaxID=2826789 RepID=A0A8S5R826_9VIRU|nr:MAG TPA: hypothetical protein [virus sp. ct1Uu26]
METKSCITTDKSWKAMLRHFINHQSIEGDTVLPNSMER